MNHFYRIVKNTNVLQIVPIAMEVISKSKQMRLKSI
jgi:hypothetical protein